jgi:hypothetical protein
MDYQTMSSYITTAPLLTEAGDSILTETGEPLLIEELDISSIRFSPFDRFGEQHFIVAYGEHFATHAAAISTRISSQKTAATTTFSQAMETHRSLLEFLRII